MTQEEAIVNLEKLIALFHTASEQNKMVDYSKIIETLEFAAAALRPVSRERVEQIKGVWIFNDDWWEFRCSECRKSIGNMGKYKFCPHCGAPMTDEAVQMVMERLEALYGQEEAD